MTMSDPMLSCAMDPAAPLLLAEDEAAPPPDVPDELSLELLVASSCGGSTGRPPGLVMIWVLLTVAFPSANAWSWSALHVPAVAHRLHRFSGGGGNVLVQPQLSVGPSVTYAVFLVKSSFPVARSLLKIARLKSSWIVSG